MSDQKLQAMFSPFAIRDALACIRKDRVAILLVALFFAVAGATVGKLQTVTTSNAQLILTPLPLRENLREGEDNPLARMMVRPLGIKTAVLICQSDEVMEKTLEALHSNATQDVNVATLQELKDALSYRISIEKETPYDLDYSPILELTARAALPADAKLIVNTWAAQCVDAAKRLQEVNHRPAMQEFAARAEESQRLLTASELEYRTFKEKLSIEYLMGRIEEMTKVRGIIETARAEAELDAVDSEASAITLQERLDVEKPKVSLQWTPTDGMLSAMGAKVGPRSTSQGEASSSESLSVETVNDTYSEVSTELARTMSKASGARAKLDNMSTVIASFEQEMTSLKSELAEAQIEDARLARHVEIYAELYKNAALNREYAQMASELKHQQLQLLSQGVEWVAPRFRFAILSGVAAGLFSLIGACFCSIGARMIVRPMLSK